MVGFWAGDIPDNLEKADGLWSKKEPLPSSSKSWKAINDNDGTCEGPAPIAG